MKLRVEFDELTSIKVAEYFESIGMKEVALQMWRGVRSIAPYNRVVREKLGDLLFELHQAHYVPATLERSQFILRVIEQAFPTEKLTRAYFDNLEQLLKTRTKRDEPGYVVLGTGTGRCGSTSLTSIFANLKNACATHENPPLIYWKPEEEQIRFHMDRFAILRNYFQVVFDASHWWLNVLEHFFSQFPDGKVIGIYRETESCVKSFASIKGKGRNTINHWAPPDNGLWGTNFWDPVYPSYPVPANAEMNVDTAKIDLIRSYVTEYNKQLMSLAKTYPERLSLLQMEELNDSVAIARLGDFIGLPLKLPDSILNTGNVTDGVKDEYRL